MRCINCLRTKQGSVHGPFHDDGQTYIAYIAGPMVGYPDYNRIAFDEVAFHLRTKRHWIVENPHEFDHQLEAPTEGTDEVAARAWYLQRDFQKLSFASAIVMLPGWEESKGANLELMMARAMDLNVYETCFWCAANAADGRDYHEDVLWVSGAMPVLAVAARHLAEVTNKYQWLADELAGRAAGNVLTNVYRHRRN